MFLFTCPVCEIKSNSAEEPTGIIKCEACNSMYKPRATKQSPQPKKHEFMLQFSDSEEEELASITQPTSSTHIDLKPTTARKFELDLSEFDDPPQTKSARQPLKFTFSFSDSEDDDSVSKPVSVVTKMGTPGSGDETPVKYMKKSTSLSTKFDFSDSEDEPSYKTTEKNKTSTITNMDISEDEAPAKPAKKTLAKKTPAKKSTAVKKSTPLPAKMYISDSENELTYKTTRHNTISTITNMDSSEDDAHTKPVKKAHTKKTPVKKSTPYSMEMDFSDSEDESSYKPKKKRKVSTALNTNSSEEDAPKEPRKKSISLPEMMDSSEDEIYTPVKKATYATKKKPTQQRLKMPDSKEKAPPQKTIQKKVEKPGLNSSEVIADAVSDSDDETFRLIDREFSDIDSSGDEASSPVDEPVEKARAKTEIYKKGDMDNGRKKQRASRKTKYNDDVVKPYYAKPTNRYNPFILFNQQYRGAIKDLNPNANNEELSALVKKNYYEMDAETKAAFVENARRKAGEMRNSLSPVPKLPASGFLLFKSANYPKFRAEENDFKLLSKLIGQKWKDLPEDEKKVYNDESARNKEEFKLKYPQAYKDLIDKRSSKNLATKRRNEMNRSDK